jgi:hypothetical protein
MIFRSAYLNLNPGPNGNRVSNLHVLNTVSQFPKNRLNRSEILAEILMFITQNHGCNRKIFLFAIAACKKILFVLNGTALYGLFHENDL